MSEQSRLGAGGQTKQVWSGGQVQRRLQRQQGLKQTCGPLMPGSQASPICCAAPEVTGPHGEPDFLPPESSSLRSYHERR